MVDRFLIRLRLIIGIEILIQGTLAYVKVVFQMALGQQWGKYWLWRFTDKWLTIQTAGAHF